MSVEIKVPALPESVADATIVSWHKKPGERITKDENLVDIETDKVVLEVVAPADGMITSIEKGEGDTVVAGEVIAIYNDVAEVVNQPQTQEATKPAQTTTQARPPASTKPAQQIVQPQQPNPTPAKSTMNKPIPPGMLQPRKIAAPNLARKEQPRATTTLQDIVANLNLSPAIRRALVQYNIKPEQIKGSGGKGRITKEDIVNFIKLKRQAAAVRAEQNNIPRAEQATAANVTQANVTQANVVATSATESITEVAQPAMAMTTSSSLANREEKRVSMTRLRAKIAERLLHAQNNAAILTTFNEVNMQPIMDLRTQYKESFEKKHGVRLGFMSFFIHAVVEALKNFPAINASIDGNDIVYHSYYDVGVAVSSPRGLVVPIIRNAENLDFAGIEQHIIDFSDKAKNGKLTIEEMTGGTFSITNGGVFGSLMSTPILNPPQSAILGMHKIEQRPVVVDGEIVIRPMMYLALSYDHCIVDGSESVRFLVMIKELLEDPARLLLHV